MRYVGKSLNPKQRFTDHLRESRTGTFAVHSWIRGLAQDGHTPTLVILEEVDASTWEETERRWIKHWHDRIGKRLLNMTEGGDCGPRLQGSRHGNARLTEVMVLSVRKDRAAGMQNIEIGRKYGLTRDVVSRICLGKVWKHAGGPVCEARLQHRLTDGQVREIRELYASGKFSQFELADRFCQQQYFISRIVLGKVHKRAGGPILGKNTRVRILAERHPASKLKADQVREIRRLYAGELPNKKQLAERFGVSSPTITAIVRREIWRHI